MQAHLDRSAATTLVALSGRLTFAENTEFRQVVTGIDDSATANVVMDLAALEFIDSAGMGMLLVARDQVFGRGGRIVLRNAGGQVARMLDLAKFSDFFTIESAP